MLQAVAPHVSLSMDSGLVGVLLSVFGACFILVAYARSADTSRRDTTRRALIAGQRRKRPLWMLRQLAIADLGLALSQLLGYVLIPIMGQRGYADSAICTIQVFLVTFTPAMSVMWVMVSDRGSAASVVAVGAHTRRCDRWRTHS